jgi:hypothetical protein
MNAAAALPTVKYLRSSFGDKRLLTCSVTFVQLNVVAA